MRLTKSLDIGLMILIQLAAKDKQLNTADLAQILGVPRNHVVKVVQILTRGGYIQTRRGKGGGIRLAKPAGQISIQEIIDHIEGPLCLMECTSNPDVCPLSPRCRLRLKLQEAQEDMMEVFRSTTLEELLGGAD